MSDDLKHEYIRDCEAADCDGSEYRFEITRRELGLLGLGLVCTVRRASSAPVISRLHIAADGGVTLLTGKVDFGQGSRTLLTQVIVAELGIPPSQVRVVMGDTDIVPDDGGTWASLTTPETVPVVRAAAIAARDALGERLGPSARPAVVRPINGPAIVTGELKYASDFALAGMRHGRVIRGPAYKSKLVSVQPRAGVVRDGNFVGIVADTPEAATALARSVEAEWETERLPDLASMFAAFKSSSVPPKPGEGGRYPALITEGDVRTGFAESVRRHKAEYVLPTIAHVALEPRTAVAEWKAGRVTIWTGSQAPFLVRREVAQALRIPESNVRIVAQEIGGAFGSKQRGECEIEAARLARDVKGPVKLAWTREEEFTCSYCRPAGIVEVESGVDASGRIRAWRHRNYNSGAPSLRPPYAIPHISCEFHRSEAPLRQGSYRSLAAVANTFARELHVTELAVLGEADALEYRLRNLEDRRLREALERAAERFGWGKRKGAAAGVACNIEKNARLALFVEMDEPAKERHLRVRRMVYAFDVGRILHPDGLRNQAQGALIQGIGGALFEELKFDARAITNGRMSRYRVPRFSDTPEIDVILIDHPEIPSAGAGEASITVVAPAIAGALRGKLAGDFRRLPFETRL